MPSHRFYCPSLAVGVNELPADEAHHAAAVMRSRRGDDVELFNGKGLLAAGLIEEASRRSVTVRVEKTQSFPFELRHRLTLAVAMSKAHRQGYLVEKCTELGVAAIWPIIAARSVTQPGEAAVEKWSRRSVEAAKQSGRAWVPTISPVMSFGEALSRAGQFHVALFADLDHQVTSILRVLESHASATELIAFVGSEGGWTDEERRAAIAAELTLVSLSPTVLRAETAAVAVCATIAALSADG